MAIGNRTDVFQLGKFSLPANFPKIAKGPPPIALNLQNHVGPVKPPPTSPLIYVPQPGSEISRAV